MGLRLPRRTVVYTPWRGKGHARLVPRISSKPEKEARENDSLCRFSDSALRPGRWGIWLGYKWIVRDLRCVEGPAHRVATHGRAVLATGNCTAWIKQAARVFSSCPMFRRACRFIASLVSSNVALTRFSQGRTLAASTSCPATSRGRNCSRLPRTIMHSRKLIFRSSAIGACAPTVVRGPAETIHPADGSTRR